jgi:demethylmenaquinone methyltransferase/2-methoxy-6-polyprenyl-1,4-benzoquinol methylase
MSPLAPHRPLPEFYGDASQRETFVRRIFDETAPWYDHADSVMSLGSGDQYRRAALQRAGLEPGMRLLDVASGTGVVARAAAEILGDNRSIVGLDPSIGMLTAGRERFRRTQSVTECLPFRASSFDFISIGFALRHFADLDIVFAECFRVLRPSGRMLILEITTPSSALGRGLLGAYLGWIVPTAIRWRAGKQAARLMRYYWATTRDCVRPEAILTSLARAGFQKVDRHVEFAVFSEYVACRSAVATATALVGT